ncbi:MAG: hypothetical protein Kow00107_01510 [Planctomycetota bacterium]
MENTASGILSLLDPDLPSFFMPLAKVPQGLLQSISKEIDAFVVVSAEGLSSNATEIISSLYKAFRGDERVCDLRWPSVVQAVRSIISNASAEPFANCVQIRCATDPLACHTSVLSATAIALLDGSAGLSSVPLEAGFLLFRPNGCGVATFTDDSVEWGSGRITIPAQPELRTGWEAFFDHVHIEGKGKELVDPLVSFGGLSASLLMLLPSLEEYLTSDVLRGVSSVYRAMDDRKAAVVFETDEAAARAAAWDFVSAVNIAVERRGSAYVALAGGTTPGKMFRILQGPCFKCVPWSRVHFFWSDERPVGPDSERSNFRLARDGFLEAVGVPSTNLHRVHGEFGDLESEAARYEKELRELVPPGLDGIPAFDWIMLGVGADGHTASLFPGREPDEGDGRIVTTGISPDGERRVTFTFGLINSARRVVVLAVGASKAAPITAALSPTPDMSLPISHVNPRGHLVFYIDRSAGQGVR